MTKTEHRIAEWAEDVVNSAHLVGFSGINVIEKILRDPGISTKGGRHRVLWWPRNKRLAEMSRHMHKIDPIPQVCLIVCYGRVLNEDGTVFDKYQLARNSSLTVREINRYVKSAKIKLQEYLGFTNQRLQARKIIV